MDGWSDPDGWRHEHVCPSCFRRVVCHNPACPEPDFCPECLELIAHGETMR